MAQLSAHRLLPSLREILSLLVILIVDAGFCFAQSVSFRHVGIESGLSISKVNSLMRDAKGFVWASTAWGVDRYDGYEIRTLTLPDSLASSSEVLSVHELDSDSLLIKTTNGFLIYSRRCMTFAPAEPYFRARGTTANVEDAWVDNYRNLWTHSNRRVTVSPIKGKPQSFMLPADLDNSCNTRYGLALYLDNGCVLRCYAPNDGDMPAPQTIVTPLKGSCRRMKVDFEGNLWMLNARGDSIWFRRQAGIDWKLVNNMAAWNDHKPNNIVDMVADSKGRLWLATKSDGVLIVDRAADKCIPLRRDPLRPDGLRSDNCSCLLSSTDGYVFVGYAFSGFSVHTPTDFVFENVMTDNLSLTFSKVMCIVSDGKEKAYLASDDNGLFSMNVNTKKTDHLLSARNAPISALLLRPDGNLWVAFVDGRLAVSNNGATPVHIPDDVLPEFRAQDSPPRMAVDNHDNVWIAADSSVAINLHGAPSSQFVKVKSPGTVVRLSTPMSGDGVVVLTRTAVLRARLENMTPVFDTLLVADVALERIYDAVIDKQGVLWLASARRKVTAYAPDSNSHFYEVGGISQINPVSLLPLNGGGVHIATPEDVYKAQFVPQAASTTVFEHFHRESLLNVGRANHHSVCQMPDGDVWIGTERGVVAFRQSVGSHAVMRNVVFSNLLVNGEPVTPSKRYNEIMVLPDALPYTDHINLPVSSDVFSLRFAVPCASQSGISYVSELVGPVLKSELLNEPVFTFHNLPAGDYVFKVWAKDSMGHLSSSPASLTVHVRTPWRESAWARGFMIFAGILMAVLFTYIIVSYRGAVKINEIAKAQAERAMTSAEVSVLRRQALVDMAYDISSSLAPLSFDVGDAANWKGLSPEVAIRMNRLNDRLMSTNSLITKVINSAEVDYLEESFAVRNDVCGYVRQICSSVADIICGSVDVRFSSPMRNCFIAFDAVTLRYVVVDILSDAILSAQEEGFVNVRIDKERVKTSMVSITFELGGILPVGSRYFGKSQEEITLRKTVIDRLAKMNAELSTHMNSDGMNLVILQIPANKS